MKFDVVGFGALNVDKLYRVNKIAGKDEESFIKNFKQACGGSAANTIVGLARLGLKVGYIGKIAQDIEGKLLLKDFEKEGVNIDGIIVSKKGRSGVVLGFVDENGERALYVDPGVNSTIQYEEINVKYAENTSFLHLTSFVGETSFETQKRLVKKIPSSVKVSLDPGTIYARKGLTSLESIIKRCFVLFLNEIEMKLLTGKGYREGAEMFVEMGVDIVAVKLGAKGCYVTDGKEACHVEPFKAKVVDTTGAGDAFNAGFLYGLLKGKNLRECGRLGNFVASKCIEKIGARRGLPYAHELKDFKNF
ncbi:MAG: carbohydrate kinase family protein [Candidatus Bathyarchaeia archaeon]